MNKANENSSFGLIFCVTATAVMGIGCLLSAGIEAAVVTSGGEKSQATSADQWPEVSDSSGLAEETTTPKRRQVPAAPSGGRESSQVAPMPTTPSVATPQVMPLPPTYAPGSPASATPGSAGSLPGALPAAPTSFGLYDSTGLPDATGQGRPGQAMPSPMGPNQSMPGGLGVGMPNQPTPTSPLGMAMPDPTYGRYAPDNVSQSTAPPQPAQVGQRSQQVLRGSKPFSEYRPQGAYSPYMSLFREQDTARGLNTYYEYVKPALERQQQTQQTQREIQGLQDTVRYGAQGMPQTGQRPGNVIPNQQMQRQPATFMNYQQYYPQSGRGR